MGNLLTNGFRKIKQYVITWKSKQKKSDWFAYLFFWIGVIGTLCLLKLFSSGIPLYAWIVLSLTAGVIIEGLYMIIFSIIYVTFFY